ncbi:hypothetical protein OAM32_03485, partial [Alphaproteobacteria bacterium]|nr:hypothetical protein [Alphaproteobacteria bacterium]
DFTAEEITNGLWILVPFLTLFLFGLGVGEKAFKLKSQEKPPTKTSSSFKVQFFTLLLIYLFLKPVEYIIFSDPSNSIFALERGADLAMGIATKVFVVFFSSDAFLFAILVLIFLSQGQMSGKTRRLINGALFALVVFELFCMGFLGSRGGGFRIFMMVLSIYLVTERNKTNLFLAIIVSTIAVTTNYALLDFFQGQRANFNLEIAPITLSEASSEVSSEVSSEASSEASIEASIKSSNLSWLLNRLGYADYLIITQAREPDKDCSEKYMQISYYSKNVINFISPGNPYPEAKISSSNAFGPCYRDAKVSNFSFYHSEVWGLSGLLKLSLKNTFLTLISGLVIGLILGSISSLAQHGQGFGSRFIHIQWIYFVPYMSIFSMGVDHSINTMITAGLRVFTVLILVQASTVIFKHCRRLN